MSQADGDILENLPFKEAGDYKTATQVAETMISLYPDGKDVKKYKSIVSNYKLYTKEEKNSNGYKGIKKKWDNKPYIHIINQRKYLVAISIDGSVICIFFRILRKQSTDS